MTFKKQLKNYVSEIDLFLAEFDAKQPLSPSQREEIALHAKIARQRDKTESSEKQDPFDF